MWPGEEGKQVARTEPTKNVVENDAPAYKGKVLFARDAEVGSEYFTIKGEPKSVRVVAIEGEKAVMQVWVYGYGWEKFKAPGTTLVREKTEQEKQMSKKNHSKKAVAAAKEPKVKKAKAVKVDAAPRRTKAGMIDELLAKGGVTIQAIADTLLKEFPDNPPTNGMLPTVYARISNLAKAGRTITKEGKGVAAVVTMAA